MSLRVAGIQRDITWEDRDDNLATAADEVTRAVATGADLVVLPEMFATGFSMATDLTGEPPDGPTATFLRESSQRHGIWVGGTFACTGDHAPLATNRFLLAGPEGQVHVYDKIHPFSHAGEDDHFTPGRSLEVVEVDGVRVALFVCYDLRFPSVFWQLADRVDLYVVPANWPAARSHHWRSLLVARAIENQAFVLGVNRVGIGRRLDGKDLPYTGDSMLVDPLGTIIAEATGQPGMVMGQVDPTMVTDVRSTLRFLPDRHFSADL